MEPAAPSALERLGRRMLVPLLLAVVVLVLLAMIADGGELLAALRRFDPRLLVPVLALSLLNYGLRFLRWELYLRSLAVRLTLPDSLAILLVGFVLSITPGKAGELGKAWLARSLGGGAARRTVAVVIAERVSDLVGMLLVAGLGALALPGGGWLAAGCAAAAVTLVSLLGWAPAIAWLLRLGRRLPRLGDRLEILEEVYGGFRSLLRPRLLLPSTLLSAVAWGAEGVGFWLVVRAYDPAASWLVSLFNYGASTLAGAVSMLPGGLLASEGALTALLGYQGLDTAAAASATLVIRGATLWFAVGLGLAALPYLLRRLGVAQAGQADRAAQAGQGRGGG